jgi:hypothetical protein
MYAIRYVLATLACACISAASASTVSLQLVDLSYSAYSLDPQGGAAAVGLLQDPYHVEAHLLGTREEKHEESTWPSGGIAAGVWGASTRTPNAAHAFGGWNKLSGNQFYNIDAEAAIDDPLSQWYFAETKLNTGATLTLTPSSVVVVSGHLMGRSELLDTDARGTFSAVLEGGGAFSAYQREFGTGSPLSAVNDFFTLTLFNRTDSAMDFNWKLDTGLAASREIPAIPEPSAVSMALAGMLVLLIPHAACALRRQRTAARYRAAPLQWLYHSV